MDGPCCLPQNPDVLVEPHTEGDPVAILVQLLVAVGNARVGCYISPIIRKAFLSAMTDFGVPLMVLMCALFTVQRFAPPELCKTDQGIGTVTPPPPDTTPPSTPTNLTATATSSSQINLTWTASTDNVGVTGYKVFRNGTQVATPNGTSFSDTGLAAATTCAYTVAAYDAAGNTSAQSAQATGSYTTNFPLSENPISEGGAWHHLSPYETVVKTEVINGVHVAHGTQVGGAYDNSNAYLSGFTPNQSVEGVIWKKPGIATIPNQEVEILVRWSDNSGPPRNTTYGLSAANGYEINVNQNGDYLNLGQFKGPLLAEVKLSSPPFTGDVFKVTAIDDGADHTVITVYWNGVQVMKYTDMNPILTGNPGMGFFISNGAANNEFGFSSFTATSLGSDPDVTAPSIPTKRDRRLGEP